MPSFFFFFFFNDTATTEIYTLSLHDALPICLRPDRDAPGIARRLPAQSQLRRAAGLRGVRAGRHGGTRARARRPDLVLRDRPRRPRGGATGPGTRPPTGVRPPPPETPGITRPRGGGIGGRSPR